MFPIIPFLLNALGIGIGGGGGGNSRNTPEVDPLKMQEAHAKKMLIQSVRTNMLKNENDAKAAELAGKMDTSTKIFNVATAEAKKINF